MKEQWLSEIDPIEYDRVVYPNLVLGNLVAQGALDSDFLIMQNEEKMLHTPGPTPPPEIKPVINPLQGEFNLQNPRSGTPRGRRG